MAEEEDQGLGTCLSCLRIVKIKSVYQSVVIIDTYKFRSGIVCESKLMT